MRGKKEYMVLTFHTTTEAMAMETICEERQLPGRLIPVPREITAGCGLAWRIPVEEYQIHEQEILQMNLPYQQIVRIWI